MYLLVRCVCWLVGWYIVWVCLCAFVSGCLYVWVWLSLSSCPVWLIVRLFDYDFGCLAMCCLAVGVCVRLFVSVRVCVFVFLVDCMRCCVCVISCAMLFSCWYRDV